MAKWRIWNVSEVYETCGISDKEECFTGEKNIHETNYFISNKNNKDLFSQFLDLFHNTQAFPTYSLLPSILLHLPYVWLGKWQHMLWQIYSYTCADCPNIYVCWLASWLLPPEVSIGLDWNGFSFSEMLMRALAITRNSFSQNKGELVILRLYLCQI